MKRTTLFVIAFLMLTPSVFAQLSDFTVVSSGFANIGNVGGTVFGMPSMSCYNFATDHILWADYTNDRIVVTDPDGTNATVLDTSGVTDDSDAVNLDFFTVACTKDGRIFVGSQLGGSDGNAILYYANESATPVEVKNVENMEFPRAMKAQVQGDGSILIGVTGGGLAGGMDVSIHRTTNGASYTHVETYGNPDYPFKQSLDFGYTADLAYGCQGDGGYRYSKWVRDATSGDMVADTAYAPVYGDLGSPTMIGYMPGHNQLFMQGSIGQPNGNCYLVDGDTGASVASQALSNAYFASLGYGSVSVNEESGEAWITCRATLGGYGVMVELSYDIPATPTPAGTATPTDTPMPTNTPSTGIDRFDAYE